MHSRVVGLTGGIASGKSTVARAFAELGVPVIDADLLAREVVTPGSPGLAEIAAAFGPEVLTSDGTLDRKAMAARVFADPAARRTLNQITHPKIAKLSFARVTEALATGAPYVVYDATLIVENRLHHGMLALVVVGLDPSTQRDRLVRRDGLSVAEAEARISAQAPLDQKLEAATYVVDNNGQADAIAPRVREIHRLLLTQMSGQ